MSQGSCFFVLFFCSNVKLFLYFVLGFKRRKEENEKEGKDGLEGGTRI